MYNLLNKPIILFLFSRSYYINKVQCQPFHANTATKHAPLFGLFPLKVATSGAKQHTKPHPYCSLFAHKALSLYRIKTSVKCKQTAFFTVNPHTYNHKNKTNNAQNISFYCHIMPFCQWQSPTNKQHGSLYSRARHDRYSFVR